MTSLDQTLFRFFRPLAFLSLISVANAATFPVTVSTDTVSGGLAGTGAGQAGDLRAQIIAANAAGGSNTITFTCAAPPCTITLGGPLPPITSNLTIDGGTLSNIVIDGASAYRVFFVNNGTVALQNLVIQNGRAQGGAGGTGDGGGGGGAGLGGGLFVNQATAAVTLTNVRFINSSAVGGAGGTFGSHTPPGGGGGGMAFAGGNSTANTGAPGGGGMLAAGASVSSGSNGGAGGAGGGGGGGVHTAGTVGAASTGYAGNPGGSAASLTTGGNGGFGGGGGGAAVGIGGAGGFGGGGGGTGAGTQPGNGGPGGGGGAADGGTLFGTGGSLGSSVAGGNSGTGGGGGGGGGAAAGAAIFVNAGSLVLVNTSATGSSATGGAGGIGQSSHNGSAGTASSSSLFNYAGTVNSAATTGPLTVLDTRPTANSVTITGTAQVGSSLAGAYVYADPSGVSEGTSTLRWVRNASNAGASGGVNVATTSSYAVANADLNMFLYFCVTPVRQGGLGLAGNEVCSTATAAITSLAVPVPTASALSISGTAQVGSTLTGNYTYANAGNSPEATSTFRWLRNSSSGISGASSVATTRSYTAVDADAGNYLFFCVTPVAQSGAQGAEVCSSATDAVASTAAVPTLSEWAAILLAAMVGAIGVLSLRRRGGLSA